MLDLAEQTDVITRKGAWYSYNGDNISQGRDNAVKYLEENPQLATDIEQQVRENLELGAVVAANTVSQIEVKSEETTDDSE